MTGCPGGLGPGRAFTSFASVGGRIGISMSRGGVMPQRVFPPLPEIGRPETYYAKMVHRADKAGDTFAHEAYKVGQYVTLAMAPNLSWEQKLRYLTHALKRHCQPPPFPDDEVW